MVDVTGITILVGCVDPEVSRRGKTKGGHLSGCPIGVLRQYEQSGGE